MVLLIYKERQLGGNIMLNCKLLELRKNVCDEYLERLERGDTFSYWTGTEQYDGRNPYVVFLTLLKETEDFYYVIVEDEEN